ncbi:MAG: Uma2 family endonuclease [Dehalococcoidia bacterium]
MKLSVPPTIPRRRFTVDEYYCMAEAGILHDDDRVELLDGEIIEMSAIGDKHFISVLRSNTIFSARLAGRALVSVQSPVRLSSGSEPEPDITLLRPRQDFYGTGKPGPEDVLLLIEVSDTTLVYDRDVKLPFYAAAGIPEVWIVDLNAARVLVYREPQDGAYRQTTVVARDGVLSPVAFPDLVLPVAEIVG